MLKGLKQILSIVWKDRWEAIVALIGFVTAFASNSLPVWAIVMIIGISFILLIAIIRAMYRAYVDVKEKHIPIIVLIGKPKNTADSMWVDVQRAMEKYHFNSERYRRDFEVERSDVFIHVPEPLPATSKKWIKLCKQFREQIELLNQKLAGRRIYHVFLNGPAALAIGLGAACGTKFEMVIHQWDPGIDPIPYLAVGDFSKIKQGDTHRLHYLVDPAADEFKYIAKPEEVIKEKEQLGVCLYLAKDDPRQDAKRYLQQLGKKFSKEIDFIEINQIKKRRLDAKDDWIRCAKEILTVINALFSKARRERMHIFLSSPTALAFMVGLGLEHFRPITVYNWWPGENVYHPVIPLESLGRTILS